MTERYFPELAYKIKKWINSIFFYTQHAIVCVMGRLTVVFLLVMLIACEQKTSQRFLSKANRDEVARFVSDTYSVYPLPGIGVAIIDADQSATFVEGKATTKSATSFSDTTIFYSGNISELLVATTVLRLADAGKIQLDDPIVKHLPYFKLGGNTFQNITIRHMLTHSSGIPHHGVIYDPPTYDDHALEVTTRSIEFQEPVFKAGSKIKRSPYNFDILADLVQKVTGQTFEVYAKKQVLDPLGMHQSTFSFLDIASNNLARPHQIKDWLSYSLQESSEYPYSREHAGSRGFHTTLKDMERWMKMVVNNGVVDGHVFLRSQTMNEFMKRCYKLDEHKFAGVAWEIESGNDKIIYSKGENAHGFSTSLVLVPAAQFAVLSVSNISGDFDAGVVNREMINLISGKSLSRVKMPVGILFSRKIATSNNLDSAFAWYESVKGQPEVYALSEDELSQPGVNLLYRLDRPQDAIRVFEFCLKHFPQSATAYLNLAEAHLLQHALREAATALNKAKDLHPSHPDVLARIAFVEDRLKVGQEKASLITEAANP